MATPVKPTSESQGEHSFARRLSPLIAAVGVTPVPDLLIRYQARLGLTSNELVYLLNVLSHRREDGRWSWASVGEIAHRTGAGERSVRDWRASLVKKGYLILRARGNTGREGGGRLSDEHDLSPLFAALEALALEEAMQPARDQVHREVPAPTYCRDRSSVPYLVRAKGRRLETQRAHPELGNYAETCIEPPTPSLPVPAGSTLPEPAEETEAVKQRPLTPLPPAGERGDEGREETLPVRKPDDSFQPALPRTAAVGLPTPRHHSPGEELLAGFYQGLDSDLSTLTRSQRPRLLKLAQELAAVGATPAEAEAYAREVNANPQRIAPPTLHSFAKERQAWLQRRDRLEASGPRLVDRTGQPPSWSTASGPAERLTGEPLGSTVGSIARALVGGASP